MPKVSDAMKKSPGVHERPEASVWRCGSREAARRMMLPYKKVRFTWHHTGLLPHLEGRVFSAEDVQHQKPAPDPFLHAAASLDVPARHCTVVEDSPTGVAAAKAAGMLVFGFAAMGQHAKLLAAGADAVFQSMSELPHLIQSARVAA